jgi:hypothetical protein
MVFPLSRRAGPAQDDVAGHLAGLIDPWTYPDGPGFERALDGSRTRGASGAPSFRGVAPTFAAAVGMFLGDQPASRQPTSTRSTPSGTSRIDDQGRRQFRKRQEYSPYIPPALIRPAPAVGPTPGARSDSRGGRPVRCRTIAPSAAVTASARMPQLGGDDEQRPGHDEEPDQISKATWSMVPVTVSHS